MTWRPSKTRFIAVGTTPPAGALPREGVVSRLAKNADSPVSYCTAASAESLLALRSARLGSE